MKINILFLILFVVFISRNSGHAQIHFIGNLNSSLYAWEMSEGKNQMDFYQGVQLRVFQEKFSNLQFKTNFRFARRGDPAVWNEKVYSSYLKWNSTGNLLEIKAGRQFMYHGVMNGTVDGLLLSGRLSERMVLKILAGMPAPVDRKLELTDWETGNVFGGFTSYQFSKNIKANLSFFQKERNGESVWQQLGTQLSGKLVNNVNFNAKIDFNLKSSDYQNMLYRLSYLRDKWTITAEYNSLKPRVYEDSYFRIFEIEANDQIRTGIAYQLGNYQLGLRHIYTMYEDENSNQLQLTCASKWGLLGLIYQNGYGGDNSGLFGELHYDIFRNVTIKLFSSYYNYQRHTIDISEDALAFSGKVEYRPLNYLHFQVEAQQSQNSYYNNELRGLFRLSYMFNHSL